MNRVVIADADEVRAMQISAGLRRSGLNTIIQGELVNLPHFVVGSVAAVLDTDVAGVDAGSREFFVQFVRGLRYYRPELRLITIAHQSDAQLSLAMVDLNVDWHFDREPDIALLVAQVKRLLREVVAPPGVIRARVGQLLIDRERGTAELHGAQVSLSPRERSLLEILMKEPGRVYTRAEIAVAMRPQVLFASERAIDVLISRLRLKLTTLTPDGAILLRTVTGVGYALGPVVGGGPEAQR
jgi:DNA-binding response OmpR family regulator